MALRVLPRNRWRMVYWVPPTGRVELVDEDGHRTGEYATGWGEPISTRANVNPPQGFANGAPYGTATDYDLIIALDRDECAELGVEVGWRVWLDEPPTYPDPPAPQVPTDFSKSFMVERVSPSPHYVQVGIRTARGE